MQEVSQAADTLNIKPATVLQNAAALSGRTWENWQNGAACSVKTAQKVREWIQNELKEAATQ